VKYQLGDVMLTVMPLFHAMANYFSLQALYNGYPTSVHPMPDPGTLMQLIARDRVTIVPLVPTVIQMLLDHPRAAEADYSLVRLMIYAGASIDPTTLKRAMETIRCDFMQLYGATETGGGPCTYLWPEHHKMGEDKLKSCGKELPLVEMKVVDPQGDEVPDGQVGEFLIRSPILTKGYFKQPQVTADAFRGGWYRSGDAGFRDADGFFYIVDRVKDMIITGGENVYSKEVEQALQAIPGVQMCAAVGLPDPKWGERVVAVVMKAPGTDLTEADVIAGCRRLIAGYKVPKEVRFVDSLPMTSTGKVTKRALRDRLLAQS